MQSDIEKDKRIAIATLKDGLTSACADSITEVLINLEDGTCDYAELIPILEEIAQEDWFCYFDDNGSGGMPHADPGRNTSFRSWARKAIENIQQNCQYESTSVIHRALKSNSTHIIESTLEYLKSEDNCADRSLLPILEKIARKNVYKSYSYFSAFQTESELGELAQAVIQIIVHHSASRDNMHKPSSSPDTSPGI